MDRNEELRKRLIEYLEMSGVSQLHICKVTGTPDYVLSRWKNGIKKELYQEDLDKLEEYLDKFTLHK